MVTARQLDKRKDDARSMLVRGRRCSEIANFLSVHYNTCHRWLSVDDDGWTNDIGVGRIATHAQSGIAHMLYKMGLSQAAIGRYLGHTAPYISRLLRMTPTHGSPEVYVRITGHVRDRQHNPLSKDVPHRCVPHTDKDCLLINMGDRGTYHFTPYERLVDNVDIVPLNEQERALHE